MKRKIMQIADTTFVVSLPLKWAREHNLKKGDEVELVAEKNQLCLRFENTIDKKSYSVDVQEYNRMAGRYIVSLYRLGYDEIEVKFSDPNYVSKIPKELFENTIGFEVISQKLNSCIIKNLSESDDEELENIIKRLWFLLKEMSKDLVEAIKNKDKTTLKSMKEREKTINKFSNYCIRLLRKNNNYEKSFALYYFIRFFENISDDIKEIALLCSEKMPKKDIDSDLKKIISLINSFYDLYYSFDLKIGESLVNDTELLINELINKKNEHESYFSMYSLTKKIKQLVSVVLEVNIENS